MTGAISNLSPSAPGAGHPALQPRLWNSEVQTWRNVAIPGGDAQSWTEPSLSSFLRSLGAVYTVWLWVGSCWGWQAGAQMPSYGSQAFNRLSQSLEQPAPPQGERAWQRLPAWGTQPAPLCSHGCPLSHGAIPLHPLPPHQVSTRAVPRALVQGSKGWHFPVILGCPSSSGTSLSAMEKLRESKHCTGLAPSVPYPHLLPASFDPGKTGHRHSGSP